MVGDCNAGEGVCLTALNLFDLIEARLGVGGMGARCAELIVHIGELLVGHQLAVGGEKVVARLKVLDLLLGLADAVLQLFEPRG